MGRKCAVILATGKNQQTEPGQTDALCQLLFRPMVRWVYDNCTRAGIEDICVAAGDKPEDVQRELPEGALIVSGGGRHGGVLCARAFVAERRDADVLVVSGTAPFLFPDVLVESLAVHQSHENDATAIATAGRDAWGNEHQTEPVALWYRGEQLLAAMEEPEGQEARPGQLPPMGPGPRTETWFAPDHRVGLQGSSRRGLALLSQIARDMVLALCYDEGVDIPIPDGIIIDPRATIGPGTQILPGTVIRGASVIGKNAVIGPNSWVEDSTVGDGCVVNATYILGSVLEEDVQIGPFTRVRPGSRLGAGVRIGNFVEVKNASVGPGTKSAHLTYIGDADVGARVNFGCGVCIANYDGVQKHRTTIGDDCFLGCNTNLVAPVSLGDGAYTAAGTTVTEDVPPDALCIGRSRQTVLPERAKEHQKHPRR